MRFGKVLKGVVPFVGAVSMCVAVSANAADGEKVFNGTCKTCHGTGIGGAPKIGDKAAWADRIAQGMATLEEHAIKGFRGKGLMPPKGGRSSLSNDEVKAAVAYMVEQSK